MLCLLLWLVEELTLFVGGVVDVGLVIVVGGGVDVVCRGCCRCWASVQLVHYFVHMYSCITWIPFLYILAYNLYCMFSFFSDFFGCILPPITLNGDSCNKNIDIKFSVHVHNTFLE